MSEKNLKARIVHKHDTQANWEKATGFIPMKGELIVYDIDSNYSYERFKIGDGATNVNALPFFAAGALTSEGLEQVKGVKVDNATSADSANKTVGTFTVNGVAFDGSADKTVEFVQVQADLAVEDETSPAYVKNQPTSEDIVQLFMELDVLQPVADENGVVLTDTDGKLFTL